MNVEGIFSRNYHSVCDKSAKYSDIILTPDLSPHPVRHNCIILFLLTVDIVNLNDRPSEMEETTLDNCFYDKVKNGYFFENTIANIAENVSCIAHCSCNGTATGYLNCQQCCCQYRVLKEDVLPGRFIC